MLKKTITYEDLDGNKLTEDFYFNISKAEVAEMQLRMEGGFDNYLQTIVDSKDGDKIIGAFKDILMKSIGRRSEDGKRFVKSEEITKEFMETDAYSVLFMELLTDADAAAEFVRGIMPADMAKAVAEGKSVENVNLPETEAKVPAYILEDREPTQQEMAEMSREEMLEAFKRKQQKKS